MGQALRQQDQNSPVRKLGANPGCLGGPCCVPSASDMFSELQFPLLYDRDNLTHLLGCSMDPCA